MRLSLLLLGALSFQRVIAVDSSDYFSQWMGAETLTYSGPSSAASSFTICTSFVSAFLYASELPAADFSTIFQDEVVGVCDYCTSLDISRVDSCCGQTSSSACFNNFGGGKVVSATTTQVQSVVSTASAATTSPNTASATVSATTAVSSATKTSSGNKVDMMNFPRSLVVVLLGILV